jgi:hypothetical protein
MSTSTKVIHLSNEVHALAKEHCAKMGVLLKEWAERALQSTIEREDPSRKLQTFSYVQKKPLTELNHMGENDDGIKQWELPPFWERGGELNIEEEPASKEV